MGNRPSGLLGRSQAIERRQARSHPDGLARRISGPPGLTKSRSQIVCVNCLEILPKHCVRVNNVITRLRARSRGATMDADLRYPIGKVQRVEKLTESQRHELIDAIAEAPAKLRTAVAGLNDKQLDTPYRPGGWTVRQVVHHLPDSHLNSF